VRVILPYVQIYPGVLEALTADGVAPEIYDVRASSEAYYGVLAKVWADGVGFIVVEQDIVVNPGNVAELTACQYDWCGFVYGISSGYITGLGFTKFSDRLVSRCPDAVTRLDSLPPNGTPPRMWGRLDTQLAQSLMDYEGYRVHRHLPPVRHLNPVQQLPHWNCAVCGTEVPDAVVRAGEPPYGCLSCGRKA
jgi:hypothetical protein